ncbi:Uncharacterised protein [Vibrio cholerae]|nr:Uncharacterised protein [Vibrio cholerae]CSD32615.1 Uncharacterised protein [Vibrio cholerae]
MLSFRINLIFSFSKMLKACGRLVSTELFMML